MTTLTKLIPTPRPNNAVYSTSSTAITLTEIHSTATQAYQKSMQGIYVAMTDIKTTTFYTVNMQSSETVKYQTAGNDRTTMFQNITLVTTSKSHIDYTTDRVTTENYNQRINTPQQCICDSSSTISVRELIAWVMVLVFGTLFTGLLFISITLCASRMNGNSSSCTDGMEINGYYQESSPRIEVVCQTAIKTHRDTHTQTEMEESPCKMKRNLSYEIIAMKTTDDMGYEIVDINTASGSSCECLHVKTTDSSGYEIVDINTTDSSGCDCANKNATDSLGYILVEV